MAVTRSTTSLLLAIAVAGTALTGCGRLADRRAERDDVQEPTPTTAPPAEAAGAATTTERTGATAVEARIPATGDTIDVEVTTPDGRNRTAHLYVPDSLPDEPVPLLVALHGGGGSGNQFEQNSGYDQLAEANGFLVVYPDGVGGLPGGGGIHTWNGGVCCGGAARDQVDDVTFLRQLVDQVEADHDIDPDQVYATGHSNGMIMSYRLLCEAADVFVAAAGQAGTLGVDGCAPTEPVSLLHIHGEADTNLPIAGGKGAGLSGVDFPSPLDGVRTVAAMNGCDPEPEITTTDPITTETWTGCDAATAIEFVSVAGASHAWMGADAPTARPGAPEPFPGHDSSLESWTFLAAHPRRS